MKNLLTCLALVLLVSCGGNQGSKDENYVLSKFHSKWNVYEKMVVNSDGSVTYQALPFSGLVGTFLQNNLPAAGCSYDDFFNWQPTEG